jgi:hypothetical protein
MKKDAVNFAKQFWSGPILSGDIPKKPLPDTDLMQLDQALQQAAISPDTNDYDVLTALAADSLRENERMPDWLAAFVADVLERKRKRPTRRGSDKYINWERDYKLWRATQEVAKAFGLQNYTNNELSSKITAAEIVSEAAGCSTDVVITAYKRHSRMGVK